MSLGVFGGWTSDAGGGGLHICACFRGSPVLPPAVSSLGPHLQSVTPGSVIAWSAYHLPALLDSLPVLKSHPSLKSSGMRAGARPHDFLPFRVSFLPFSQEAERRLLRVAGRARRLKLGGLTAPWQDLGPGVWDLGKSFPPDHE